MIIIFWIELYLQIVHNALPIYMQNNSHIAMPRLDSPHLGQSPVIGTDPERVAKVQPSNSPVFIPHTCIKNM